MQLTAVARMNRRLWSNCVEGTESVLSMADLEQQPSLQELRAAWSDVSDRFEAALEAAPADRLAWPSPQQFPLDDSTLRGALEFLLHHESYHVGQMALLRPCFELPPMRYS